MRSKKKACLVAMRAAAATHRRHHCEEEQQKTHLHGPVFLFVGEWTTGVQLGLQFAGMPMT